MPIARLTARSHARAGRPQMGRHEVNPDVSAHAEGLGGRAEDHEEQEEGRHLVHDELGTVEEVAHEDVEGDEHRQGQRSEP